MIKANLERCQKLELVKLSVEHGNLQKQGYGKKLLDEAEQEAIKNGCVFSAVDTFDFQAEEFYLKNGYKRVSELKNCWFGHSKFFLRKNLS